MTIINSPNLPSIVFMGEIKSIKYDVLRNIIQYYKSRKRKPKELMELLEKPLGLGQVLMLQSACGSHMVIQGLEDDIKRIVIWTKKRGGHTSYNIPNHKLGLMIY